MEQRKQPKETMTDRLATASIQGAMMGIALNALMPVAGQALTSGVVKKMAKSAAGEGVKILTEDEKGHHESDINEKIALDILTHGLGR